MTEKEFADLCETVHQLVVDAVKDVARSADVKVFDKFVLSPTGDVWGGALANDGGNVHAWIVTRGEAELSQQIFGKHNAPANTFWTTLVFRLFGFYKYRVGESYESSEEQFRAEWSRMIKRFANVQTISGTKILVNTPLQSRFDVRKLADNKLAYTVTGELSVVLEPIGMD